MSKHTLKIIIDRVQNSPIAKNIPKIEESSFNKIVRKMQEQPMLKAALEIQEPSFMKIAREMQDLPALKMMREMQEPIFMKVAREMEQHQALRVALEIQEPSFMKIAREMQGSPALKMMREMQLFAIDSSRLYSDVVEESINISDEIINISHSHRIEFLNDQSLLINTLFLSIYILAAHAQVPLDQLLVTLAQNFLNSALFFCLQSRYEAAKISTNEISKSDFKNSRITAKISFLYTQPNLKSEIIEQLEQYKFLEIIQTPDLHKSWLKVRTEINEEILEGYILRSYTSPIK